MYYNLGWRSLNLLLVFKAYFRDTKSNLGLIKMCGKKAEKVERVLLDCCRSVTVQSEILNK